MKENHAAAAILRLASSAELSTAAEAVFMLANSDAYKPLGRCLYCGRGKSTPHASICIHDRAFALAIRLDVRCACCGGGIYSHVHREHCADGPEEHTCSKATCPIANGEVSR